MHEEFMTDIQKYQLPSNVFWFVRISCQFLFCDICHKMWKHVTYQLRDKNRKFNTKVTKVVPAVVLERICTVNSHMSHISDATEKKFAAGHKSDTGCCA